MYKENTQNWNINDLLLNSPPKSKFIIYRLTLLNLGYFKGMIYNIKIIFEFKNFYSNYNNNFPNFFILKMSCPAMDFIW